MIQRIQTIWLVLAEIALAIFCFLPIISFGSGTATQSLTVNNFFTDLTPAPAPAHNTPWLLIGVICVILLNLAAIFMFTNRRMQKILISIGMLLLLCAVVLVIYRTLLFTGIIDGHPTASFSQVDIGAFLMAIAAFTFMGLAIRAITKDQRLIRSADRLR